MSADPALDAMRIERPAGASPGPVEQIENSGVAAALWRKDASAWTRDPAVAAKIQNRLGWLALPEAMAAAGPRLKALAAECQQAGLRRAVLLGMGGSSLAPEVFRKVFGPPPAGATAGGLDLAVLDTTDPVAIGRLAAGLDWARTLFIVSSKSGGTIEPNCLFAFFWERCAAALRTQDAAALGAHFVAITDGGTSLEQLAQEHRFRAVFLNPGDIGGRYSALSYFGLVPAALAGVDVERLLQRARAMAQACAAGVAADENPGVRLGAEIGAWAQAGRDKLTLVAGAELAPLGAWLEQLLAESTGKQGKGIVPVAGEAAGSPGVYGQDRVFARLALAGTPAPGLDPAWAAVAVAAGAPVITLQLSDRYDLGQEFFRWEFATAVAGAALGINPFDEPNVQESKDNTNRVLADWGGGKARPATPAAREGALAAYPAAPGAAAPSVEAALAALVRTVRPGDYFAIMAYMEREPAIERALEALRQALRDRLRIATTLGFGPRFLHSTGQLHKGGANTGVFLQLTRSLPAGQDLPIPGRSFTFGTLFAAQAAGDLEALAAHQRRALRLDVGADPAAGLQALRALLDRAWAGAETQGA
ncbi:MAG: bifunctional transaldolase/phosoglucose isomerase [Terriglobales bacterium]